MRVPVGGCGELLERMPLCEAVIPHTVKVRGKVTHKKSAQKKTGLRAQAGFVFL